MTYTSIETTLSTTTAEIYSDTDQQTRSIVALSVVLIVLCVLMYKLGICRMRRSNLRACCGAIYDSCCCACSSGLSGTIHVI